MTTSLWRKPTTFGILLIALSVMGQSCTISLGSSRGLDGGVFRSADHGQTWQQKNFVSRDKKKTISLNDVSGRVLAFDPRNPSHIYLGTRENGIWETTDAGEVWKSTSIRSGAYECIDYDPLNSAVMYTAAGTLVLKTTDGGKSWNTVYTESQPGQAVTCIAVDPFNGRLVWATTTGGKILLSEDYGKTWTLKHMLDPFTPRRLYIDPTGSGRLTIFTRNNGIFTGVNLGSSWTDLSKGLEPYPNSRDVRAVDIEPSGWYLATSYGLLQSVDQGLSWVSIKTLNTAGSVPLQNVAVNPRNGREIFITTDQKIHHTTDAGQTWAITTLPTSRLPVLLTFDPVSSDRLFLSTFKVQKK
ncbi:MAG: hypothetical protein HY975_04015 [Candidatus Kerfeldbacteria bacterium]|nr:hypothetical protein [Candidatus Kerfeldbacteria bacterium]